MMTTDDNSLRALIFDVDGTLAGTEQNGHRPAFNQAFAEFGLDWEWGTDLYRELLAVTGGRERIRHYMAAYGRGDAVPPQADLEDWIADLHGRKTEIYIAWLRAGRIPLNPGVARLLREAREAGLRLAIATTTGRQNVDGLLEANLGAEAIDWFDVIGAGDQVARKKPAPDIYRWVLGQLDLPPTQCVAIEDSTLGLAAAVGAGIVDTLICAGNAGAEAFDRASLVVDQLGEPGSPSRILRSPAGVEFECVDVTALRRLHTSVCAGLSAQRQ